MFRLRFLLQQLIGLLQEKKQAGDITVREFALKLLRPRHALVAALLGSGHHSEKRISQISRLKTHIMHYY